MPRLSKIGAAALAAFGWTSGSAVTASYLVVAGGGGGGTNNGAGDGGCGGGGAGGYRTGTEALNPTQSYSVVVGAGGASGAPDAAGSNGSNSVFLTTTSTGGGGGGDSQNGVKRAGDGGSGGGAGYINSAAGSGNTPSTSPSQGNNGGSYSSGDHGAGGGGATAAGSNTAGSPGAGGAGTANSISGSSVTYAGGGGGGGYLTTGAVGGSGGGGQGGSNGAAGISGTANLGGGGGGGGGGSAPPTVGGAGGSGVVIISYVGAQQFGGGVVTSSGGNTIHTFTTSGTLSPLSSLTASALVVAGGGGGGANGGGGGAGGYRTGSGITLDTNSTYLVTVGAGGIKGIQGTQYPTSGSNSVFNAITSTGGGYGADGATGTNRAGGDGGSGGGGFFSFAAGNGNTPSASPSQGNNGGAGSPSSAFGMGGGGGSSAVGVAGTTTTGGNGGAGTSNSISGTAVTYAGGGGGGIYFGNTPGSGGAGGGGAGGSNGSAGTDGTANTGGGGGGGGSNGSNNPDGGAGGSGIVIISYPGSTQQMAGGTVTVAGGNVIHTFTSSGYLTPIVLVNNSLRFRASASAYLSRTGGTATNAQKATYSFWMKRGALTTGQWLFTGGTTVTLVGFNGSSDSLSVLGSDTSGEGNITAAVFRDPSAWYHVVIAIDTTQTTTADRAKIYVNGVQQTVTVSNGGISPSSNWGFNTAGSLAIGRYNPVPGSYFDGYLADVNFIDGLALTPNSFGTSNGLGVWQPIRYGGSYGTNGFYLPFTANTESYAGFFNGSGYSIDTTATQIVPATGDFTIEALVYFTNLANYPVITSQGTGGSAGRFNFFVSNTGYINIGTDTASAQTAAGVITTNKWFYVAGTRSGANTAIYVNGLLAASSSTTIGTVQNTTLKIGVDWGGDYTFGYISNVRVSNVVRTISPATAPTTNFTNDASTVLLTLQGATVVDNSSNAYALTNNGTVTLGKTYPFAYKVFNDQSPQGNNWTNNNIGVLAGSTLDIMTDVPTLTSATTANYCVLNPLTNVGIGTVSNGNLQLVTSTNSRTMTGTMALPSTGQYYFEITATDYVTDGGTFFGIVNEAFIPTTPSNGTWLGFLTYSATYNNGTSTDTNGLTGTNVTNDGDIWCIAVDVTNNKFWIGRSRSGTLTWADGVTPAVNGSGATTLSLPTGTLYPMAYRGGSFNETYNFNFGQQPFAHTPPTGFVALNTFNLPTPTIGATASTTANEYFDATTYTGTGSTQNITNSGSMQPDWVWIKNRSSTNSHQLTDSVRGVNLALASDLSIDEFTGNINAFNTNGFQLTGATNAVNASGQTYVGWQWRASNATAVTNTNGSIISTVSANTTAGFSIVTYTGNSASSATVGHGLGVKPSMIIVKERSTNVSGWNNWIVYHSSIGATGNLNLNLTLGTYTAVYAWNNTEPTSSVFTIAYQLGAGVNYSSNYVAYCFAPVAGYSAFGSYTGNNASDGTFVYLGFRPRFIMIKSTSDGTEWVMVDSTRSTYNLVDTSLYANRAYSESTIGTVDDIDFLSNGFKLRNNTGYVNASQTYIYMAFAENPFKYANAR